MSKILKNTTASDIFVADVGINISANSDYTIPYTDSLLWASSSNAVTYIGNGDIVVNDGTNDLSITDGIDLIKGIFPKEVGIIYEGNKAIVDETGALKTTAVLESDPNNPATVSFSGEKFDAFGRFRISEPQSIFDVSFTNDSHPLLFSEASNLSGTVTYDSNKKSVVLTALTLLGSYAYFQSRRYFKYHPGKSQLVLLTGSFNGGASGVRKRFGFFDTDNGYFFQLTNSTLSVVLRSSVSGVTVDTQINQSSWNLDKLDGTGSSGLTLDITKQQIMVIDFQWLGSGRVRYGFFIGGKLIYCHQILNSNIQSTPYSQTADLPIRVECTNTILGATSSCWLTCATVQSEGGYGPYGILRTTYSTAAKSFSSVNSTIPLISLRKQSAYAKVPVQLVDANVFVNSADDFRISVMVNATLTGASWSNIPGLCQRDLSASAISGGTEVYSFFVRGAKGAASVGLVDIFKDVENLELGSNLLGNSDIISIVATNLTATATAHVSVNYKEFP